MVDYFISTAFIFPAVDRFRGFSALIELLYFVNCVPSGPGSTFFDKNFTKKFIHNKVICRLNSNSPVLLLREKSKVKAA